MKHLDKTSLEGLARWLCRKWHNCVEKKDTATEGLCQLGFTLKYLRDQWDHQFKAQTAPPPRKSLSATVSVCHSKSSAGRSKNVVNQAIEAILALEKRLKGAEDRAKELENILAKPSATSDILDISVELTESQHTITRLSKLIRAKRGSLGASAKSRIRQLRDNEFLRVKLNARAVKIRLRERLRHRKFELERLERSYRQTVNGESI